jgi:hypothetical protein
MKISIRKGPGFISARDLSIFRVAKQAETQRIWCGYGGREDRAWGPKHTTGVGTAVRECTVLRSVVVNG